MNFEVFSFLDGLTAIPLLQGALKVSTAGPVSDAGLPTVADEFGQSKCKNFCENLCGSILSEGKGDHGQAMASMLGRFQSSTVSKQQHDMGLCIKMLGTSDA